MAPLRLLWTLLPVAALENYCPGNDDLLIPSHSPHTLWPGWKCRRNSMIYKGTLEALETIDFNAIEAANKTILRIHLTNREVTDISIRLFQPLQSLRQLDLHLNSTHLPSHLFDTLTNLEHLSLYSNQEHIPSDLFSHLTNLQYLKLHIRPRHLRLKPHQRRCAEYKIPKYEERPLQEMLSPFLFRSLSKLEYLSIRCDCQSLPGNLFRFQSNLKTLIMNTQSANIPGTLFHGMYDLIKLEINSKSQRIVFPQRVFQHLHSLETLLINAKSVYLPSNILQKNTQLQVLRISAELENLHSNLLESLTELLYLDLSTTKIDKLPPELLLDTINLHNLRLESNRIKTIPSGFFQNAKSISTVLLGRNEIEALSHDAFHGLISLEDIHLQQNTKWELYCDYDLGDRRLFPKLKSLFFEGASNSCIHPWLKQLLEYRPDLNIEHQEPDQELKHCPLITINDLPSGLIPKHTSVSIEFLGPELFFEHQAYWISGSVDKCSDFRDILNFDSVDVIGHPMVSIADDGLQEFTFSKEGRYFLVYKYGADTPFLPYFQYVIEVEGDITTTSIEIGEDDDTELVTQMLA